jgi:hypothetical protein
MPRDEYVVFQYPRRQVMLFLLGLLVVLGGSVLAYAATQDNSSTPRHPAAALSGAKNIRRTQRPLARRPRPLGIRRCSDVGTTPIVPTTASGAPPFSDAHPLRCSLASRQP